MDIPQDINPSTVKLPKRPTWAYNWHLFRAKLAKSGRITTRTALKYCLPSKTFMYSQSLPEPSRNCRCRRGQRHADGSFPIRETTGRGQGIDRACPTVQGSVPASADGARDEFHSDEGNQERNSSVPNDDFARFLAESEERDFIGLLDGHSLNGNLPVPSFASFSPPETHFSNENVVESADDLAIFLAEVARQLSFERQGSPLPNESTTSPTFQSSLVGLPDNKSSRSGVSYTSTLGCQSIPTPLAACSPLQGSQATSLAPCEGSTTFGRDSLDFVNFSSCTCPGLDSDNASSHSQNMETISPQYIASPHPLEAPFLQMRQPRPANAMANLREEYLNVGCLQRRKPRPNRGVGPLPDLTKSLPGRKHPKGNSQAAHLGIPEPIAVSCQYETTVVYHPHEIAQETAQATAQAPRHRTASERAGSMTESLVDVPTSPRSADSRVAPRVDATIGNRGADIANRASPVGALETDVVAGPNAFQAAYDREGRVSHPVPPTSRSYPTAEATTSILPRPTIELLFHSGLRGSLYRLFLPLTKASLTKTEYEEALECIRLRKVMRKAEEDAKKRAKEAELEEKRRK
ncbi:hypothetical protein L211DRAFT_846090 [Terfezia boudieri ATCC MYA-4762]|uniref:Uncharacterized protein n=1 Tax=Terfezia boudieri ATCC MYA-4762 TaxID=1051890 RepID=A0A3N4M2M0_9PEZI|nr:hypothetical protein L211DRAFT_846090 [Terfezia boudieri ATCC MYA-4762]